MNKYYKKIINDHEYIAKKRNPEFKSKFRASCNEYYKIFKDNNKFKENVSK